MHLFNVVHRVDGGKRERKKARQKDQKNRRTIPHPEPENSDGNPRERRDRPEDLKDGIDGGLAPPPKSQRRADRNGEKKRSDVAPGDAEEARDHVLRKEAFLGELEDGQQRLPWRRHERVRRPRDRPLPERHSQPGDAKGSHRKRAHSRKPNAAQSTADRNARKRSDTERPQRRLSWRAYHSHARIRPPLLLFQLDAHHPRHRL